MGIASYQLFNYFSRREVQSLFISVMYGIIFVLLYNLEMCYKEPATVSLSALRADPSL